MLGELGPLRDVFQKYGVRWAVVPGRPDLGRDEVIGAEDAKRVLELLCSSATLYELTVFTRAILGPISSWQDAEDVLQEWLIRRFPKVIGSHDPHPAVATRPVGEVSKVTFTAEQRGSRRPWITVTFIDPGVPKAELSVSVDATAITQVCTAIVVCLETDDHGTLMTTAAQIVRAIHQSGAGELVAASVAGKWTRQPVAALPETRLEIDPPASGDPDGWMHFKGLLQKDLKRFCNRPRQRLQLEDGRHVDIGIVGVPGGPDDARRWDVADALPNIESGLVEQVQDQNVAAMREYRRTVLLRCIDGLSTRDRWHVEEFKLKCRPERELQAECQEAASWVLEQHLAHDVTLANGPVPFLRVYEWLIPEGCRMRATDPDPRFADQKEAARRAKLEKICQKEADIKETTVRQRAFRAMKRLEGLLADADGEAAT